MSELEEFRKMKDAFFKDDPASPLTPEQKKGFQGLNYYPEDAAMRFDLPVDEFPEKEQIEMQTSTGDAQTYNRYGKIKFNVDGQEAELTVYTNDQGYFLPFVDAQAGKETYGAGRYLEPVPVEDGKLYVDFNLAYNPYCAYDEPPDLASNAGRQPRMWSCPLTPFENRLKVPIRAGEKVPEGDWALHL